MGFLDNMLHNSELKLFEPLVVSLKDAHADVHVSLAEIGCLEKPGFMHKGLVIRWAQDLEMLFLHRCRNVWMTSKSMIGLDAQPFPLQFSNTTDAAIFLRQIISKVAEEQAETHKSEADLETQPSEGPDQEVIDMSGYLESQIDNVTKGLEGLMVNSGSPLDHASVKAVELATEWRHNVLSELDGEQDEKLGTLWVTKETPRTSHGRAALRQLSGRLDFLSMNNVTLAQIVEWWDATAAVRHLSMVENLALLDARTMVRYEELQDVEVSIGRSQMAFLQAICTVPVFSYRSDYSKDEFGGALTPLPWELHQDALSFLLRESQSNPNWEREAIESKSFNVFYRRRSNMV